MAKKVTKKVEENDNKKLFIMIGGIVLVLVALVLIIVLATNKPKKEDKPKEEEKPKGEVIETDEKTMEKDYGFSKENAINVVKETYQSDNYTFTAVANADNTYTVIVENSETGEVTKWTVDPSDGSRSMDD
jgi:flagellar basal body-associated protein FliL